eukprot:2861094-Amphidinium_carterae.1
MPCLQCVMLEGCHVKQLRIFPTSSFGHCCFGRVLYPKDYDRSLITSDIALAQPVLGHERKTGETRCIRLQPPAAWANAHDIQPVLVLVGEVGHFKLGLQDLRAVLVNELLLSRLAWGSLRKPPLEDCCTS